MKSVLGSIGVAPFSTRSSANGNLGLSWTELLDDPESDLPSDLSSWRRAIKSAGWMELRVLGSALFASAHRTPRRSLSAIDRRSNTLAVVDGGSGSTNSLSTYLAVM